MSGLDPRAQLAALAAAVLAALFAGAAGVAAVAIAASAVVVAARGVGRAARALAGLAPLAVALAVIDVLAGQPEVAALTVLRLGALTLAGVAFATVADPDALIAALAWSRLPYDVSFALVAGARLVPFAAADLRDLLDAARLRGLAVGGSAVERLRSWPPLLVPLLVVTIRRGLRLGETMEARGFTPGLRRTFRYRLTWRPVDTAVVLGAGAVLAALFAVR